MIYKGTIGGAHKNGLLFHSQLKNFVEIFLRSSLQSYFRPNVFKIPKTWPEEVKPMHAKDIYDSRWPAVPMAGSANWHRVLWSAVIGNVEN